MLIQKKASLARFEGKKAIIALESGQEIALLKDEIPANVQVGEELNVKIQTAQEVRLDNEALARTLLNQLLADDQEAAS